MDKKIKCINCPYYTGIQCHGHGDYWGSCALIQNQIKFLSKVFDISEYDILLKYSKSCFDEILSDDSDCLLFKVKDDD